jgi:protein arginine N-methyltransferase 2
MASIALPNSSIASLSPAALEERLQLSQRLIDAVLEHDDALVHKLVEGEGVECWVQDQQGWTALHAAACTSLFSLY